jgi:hypothetical protein
VKKKSLEDVIHELDETPDGSTNILDDNYFNNYYIDFNKDFPTDPKEIISNVI